MGAFFAIAHLHPKLQDLSVYAAARAGFCFYMGAFADSRQGYDPRAFRVLTRYLLCVDLHCFVCCKQEHAHIQRTAECLSFDVPCIRKEATRSFCVLVRSFVPCSSNAVCAHSQTRSKRITNMGRPFERHRAQSALCLLHLLHSDRRGINQFTASRELDVGFVCWMRRVAALAIGPAPAHKWLLLAGRLGVAVARTTTTCLLRT